MNEQGKQVRRTQYLINRGFQLRYMGIFVLASLFAVSVIGGLLFYLVEVNWMVQLESGLHLFPEVEDLLAQERYWVLLTAGSGFFIFAGMLSVWGLFLSHRVAGPVFALSRRMNKIVLEQDLMTPLFLRKKDALQEVKEFFNVTLESLRSRLKEEVDFWQKLQERCSAPQLQGAVRIIESLKKDKEKWLRASPS